MTRLVVSVHDVASYSIAASQAWVEALDARGVPSTLLVIPRPYGAHRTVDCLRLVEWLRERVALGDEVAQHGYTHQAVPTAPTWRRWSGKTLARACGEFWTIERSEAVQRLEAGRSELRSVGLEVRGFTPPGWLLSAGSLAALYDTGFAYTTSHVAVLDLAAGLRHRGVALSHRCGGRGERLAALLMPRLATRLVARHGLVRIALHPGDWSRPALRRAALAAIDGVLAAGGTPITYEELVRRERCRLGRSVGVSTGDRPVR